MKLLKLARNLCLGLGGGSIYLLTYFIFETSCYIVHTCSKLAISLSLSTCFPLLSHYLYEDRGTVLKYLSSPLPPNSWKWPGPFHVCGAQGQGVSLVWNETGFLPIADFFLPKIFRFLGSITTLDKTIIKFFSVINLNKNAFVLGLYVLVPCCNLAHVSEGTLRNIMPVHKYFMHSFTWMAYAPLVAILSAWVERPFVVMISYSLQPVVTSTMTR